MMYPLPKHDAEGRRIIFTRPGEMPLDKFDVDDVMRANLMLMDVMSEEDELQSVTGVLFVEDMSEFSIKHAMIFTPAKMKKMMVLWQVCHAKEVPQTVVKRCALSPELPAHFISPITFSIS